MINWPPLEDTISAWILASAPIAADRLLWAGQNAPRPEPPYIVARMAAVRNIGQDWDELTYDGLFAQHAVHGTRLVTLRLQAFGGATGNASALALLSSIVNYQRLPSRLAALNAGGVGIASVGPVQAIDGVINSATFEPRALLEVTFHATSQVVETSPFIEFVEFERVPEEV